MVIYNLYSFTKLSGFSVLFICNNTVTVLESVPLDLKAPLMLAYYIIELFSSNKQIGLLLENSIVHCCVHQLRGLQIFLSFNEV